ncbi:hypothetical protein JXA32_11160 [Candidatus Sumerlaeota bacterium]|nr:hypothetical protein [Candidatus Sumerlaeota bacterium]
MSSKELQRRILYFAAFALFFLGVLTVKFHLESRRCYRAGEQTLNEGKTAQAVVWFDRSIRALSLFNGYGRKSVAQLLDIAEGQLHEGRRDDAIETYQTVAAALAASDCGLSSSRKATISALHEKIAGLRPAYARTEAAQAP